MEKYKNIAYNILLVLIILFGVFIRTKYYIENNLFEDDECRLALSLMNKTWWQVLLPLSPWSTTPVFTLFSKFIAELTNYSEHALKFVSYAASVAGIFAFYKLSSQYFKRKVLVLAALFLFSVNIFQLYYSAIFKTYSLDILIGILFLYYLPKIDLLQFNTKKLIYLTLIFSFMPLLSLTSVFFIAVFFFINIFKNFKDKIFWKKFLIIAVPFTIVMLLYYFLYLVPAKMVMLYSYKDFYDDFYKNNFYEACMYNLSQFFVPVKKFLLCYLCLIALSVFLIIFNKKIRNKYDIFVVLTFGFSILVSVLHFYPILARTGLYLLPILFLLLIKPLDSFDVKKPFFYIALILTFLSSYVFFHPLYLKLMCEVSHFYISYSPKVLIQDIYSKYDDKNDIVITNEASLFSFLFYREKYKMFNLKYDFIEYTGNNKKDIYDYLNNVDKNKNYWFYFVKEFQKSPEVRYYLEWMKDKNLEYKRQDRNSYILYWKQI